MEEGRNALLGLDQNAAKVVELALDYDELVVDEVAVAGGADVGGSVESVQNIGVDEAPDVAHETFLHGCGCWLRPASGGALSGAESGAIRWLHLASAAAIVVALARSASSGGFDTGDGC